MKCATCGSHEIPDGDADFGPGRDQPHGPLLIKTRSSR